MIKKTEGKAMKITMDKDLTEKWMIDRTKEQMKEFKEAYTDNDLLRIFRDAINDDTLYHNYDIIRCNLRAFPGGWRETDETHYCVDMLLETYKEFVKLYFYIDQSLNVTTRKWENISHEWVKMYDVKHYTEQ